MKFVVLASSSRWLVFYCPHVAGKHFIQLEVTMKTHVKKDLDKGWHMLIQEARSIGLGIHDVRQFLESETASRKKNHLPIP